jgi:uncharacterized membrane protein YfcA
MLFAGSTAAGAATNIAVSAVAASSASVGHARAGRVDWRLAAWMVPPSVVAAFLGGFLAGKIPERLLLLAIAAVLLYSAIEVGKPPKGRPRTGPQPGDATRALGVAAAIGVLGGIVGLILGALRLPALIRIIGQRPERAVGTNQIVGASLGYAGLAGHLLGTHVDPALVVAGAIGAAPGGLVGARLTGLLSERSLRRGIAVALVVSGGAIIGRVIVG